jgi:hypothetical protein
MEQIQPQYYVHQRIVQDSMTIANVEWIWGSAQSADQGNYYWGWPHAGTNHFTTS